MPSEFKVHMHLCTEGEAGGCFSDTQTLPCRPDPATIKALLDEALETFALLFGSTPDTHVVELSKGTTENDGVLDQAATEKP